MSSSKLIQDLMGPSKTVKTASAEIAQPTDPVYVEKLASAIDFINDNLESIGLNKAAAMAPVPDDKKAALKKMLADKAAQHGAEAAPAADKTMADRVKAKLVDGLKDRLKKKEAEAVVQDDAVVQSVMGKLLRMRVSTEAPAAEAVETPAQHSVENSESHEDEDTEGKTASLADLSLADVLEGALRANELEEGVSKERSKTASVRGTKGPMARKAAVLTLKEGLMAKFGKEA
jgi:hypothetical protein